MNFSCQGPKEVPTHRQTLLAWLTCAALLVLGCSDGRDAAPTAPESPAPDLKAGGAALAVGDPLPGTTTADRLRFAQGAELFDTEFEPATGLGPLFNAVSCGECHEDPVLGGSGDEMELHAAGPGPAGSCSDFVESGGPVFQEFATPLLIDQGYIREPIPSYATVVALRTSLPLFGLGLLDAVPDDEILALADPDDTDGNGISGRPNLTPDGRVGRFGRKAVVPTLREFNAAAFRDEIGVTNPTVPDEGTVGGQELPAGVDPAPDPEIGQAALDLTDAFVRLLAPVAPLKLTKEARTGRDVFSRIDCAGCHVPTLQTGDNPVAALQHRQVTAYTDLLLHDMGSEMADICRGNATPAEFRTQPLSGLRLLPHFMHDGRAHTVEEAIEAHGGEAARARDRFNSLSPEDRAAIIAFLHSL